MHAALMNAVRQKSLSWRVMPQVYGIEVIERIRNNICSLKCSPAFKSESIGTSVRFRNGPSGLPRGTASLHSIRAKKDVE